MTELNAIADFIQRVGFPIFVAVYLLMGLQPTLHKFQRTLDVISTRLTIHGIPAADPLNGGRRQD